LNIGFVSGSVVIAGLLGLWADSGVVFLVAVFVLLVANVMNDEIRFK